MAISNVQRGAYYKSKTRKWLERQGYQVADMEVVRWVGFPKRIPVKRDQWGSDLVAMRADGIVFVQVKGGQSATGNFPAARRTFAAFTWPTSPVVCRCVIAWLPRAKAPRVVWM